MKEVFESILKKQEYLVLNGLEYVGISLENHDLIQKAIDC